MISTEYKYLENNTIKFNNRVKPESFRLSEIVNKTGEKIIRVDGDIPVDLDIKNGDRFLFISYDQNYLTHGLHKYPAKFFPELPRWLIKRYSKKGDIILDPFCGSGTTNLEAMLNERHSVGLDIDPFSNFLAKVKTNLLKKDELEKYKNELLSKLDLFSYYDYENIDLPNFPYRDNWFNKDILIELAFLRKIIIDLDSSNEIKDFFLICLSSIIRSVSNADNNCTRTVIRKKLNKRIMPSDALKKFTQVIYKYIPKMIQFSNFYRMDFIPTFPNNTDARNIQYPDNSFDLAITSPPYVNAVDYPRTHQLEIYWLNIINGSLTPLKKKHIGTESVSINDYKILKHIGIKSADNVLTKIYSKDKRRAFIAYKYLNDMNKNLKEVFRVLKSGGRYIIAVGNNKIRGELFENWKYILEIGESIGFKTELYFGSEIIKHFIKVPREERINTDWIIVFRK